MRKTVWLALGLFVAASPAAAEKEPRAELIQLMRLAISNDLCDFPLTDAQSDALTHRQEELETRLELDDDASSKLYDQIEAQMRAQKAAGLCDPKGEWAKVYAQDVGALAPK
jgi:hypothetical protein